VRDQSPSPDFAHLRRNMVDTQLRTYDVTSHRVLDAVERTPRDVFAPDGFRELAYSDRDIAISAGEGVSRSLLRPMVLARLLQALEVQPAERALDCAGGSGYGAALLAGLGASVVAIEDSEPMVALMRVRLSAAGVAGVEAKAGPIAAGAPLDGPFDVILVHGAAEVEPRTLLGQLRDGGRLGIVMGLGRSGRAVVFSRAGEVVGRRTVFDASAPALADFAARPGFAF
jgi:protein-L-isoaspartate(D-aspartate) O-methyltransferase